MLIFSLLQFLNFDDHHIYKKEELEKIKGTIVTTEKDAVKMLEFNRKDIYAMKLKVDFDVEGLVLENE